RYPRPGGLRRSCLFGAGEGWMAQPAASNLTVLPVTAPFAVLSLRLGNAKDPAALQRALTSSRIRLLACDSIEQPRPAIGRLRPIAGLLHFGGRLDGAGPAAPPPPAPPPPPPPPVAPAEGGRGPVAPPARP